MYYRISKSISPRHLRMIRNITQDNKENKIKEIMEELPLSDLKGDDKYW